MKLAGSALIMTSVIDPATLAFMNFSAPGKGKCTSPSENCVWGGRGGETERCFCISTIWRKSYFSKEMTSGRENCPFIFVFQRFGKNDNSSSENGVWEGKLSVYFCVSKISPCPFKQAPAIKLSGCCGQDARETRTWSERREVSPNFAEVITSESVQRRCNRIVPRQ